MLAGIPEEEDLACLGGRLTTSPDLQCQILRLEHLEGTRPPGYPRLVGVSFVTQTRLPRYVRVGDTSCVLRVSPKPIDPIRCYKCQGYGHYSNNCPSSDTCARCAGNHNTKACSSVHKLCANCGAQHSASYRGCEAFSFYKKVATIQASHCIYWSEAEKLIITRDRPPTTKPLCGTTSRPTTPNGPGSMRLSPGPAQGVPIQKTPSPVRSSVLPGSEGTSSPKSGGGDFRSSTPHDGEAVESVAEAVGSSSLTTVSDCSDFNVSDRDSIVSVHSSLFNRSISEVLAVEEDPILSRPHPVLSLVSKPHSQYQVLVITSRR